MNASGVRDAKAKSLRSEEHTSELQSPCNLVCRLLLEKKNKKNKTLQLRTARDSPMHVTHRTTLLTCAATAVRLVRGGAGGCTSFFSFFFFFCNDTAPTEIYPFPLHDALPISGTRGVARIEGMRIPAVALLALVSLPMHRSEEHTSELQSPCNLVCRLLLE